MIPFVDLKSQYHSIKPEIDAAVMGVLESASFVLGNEVKSFEQEFAAYCGTSHAVAVNSGTSALHLALLTAGIGPGDEVITVSMTFVATVAAIVYTGARPVFVDVDPVSYTLDPALIEAVITPHTKAILPVHLYGQMADMDPVLEIARRHRLIVIEDAAQAHGAMYQGRYAGSLGDLACFSFYPGKNLGAYGEGGLVTTGNPDYARMLRMLRDWGAERKYEHVLKGYNYRMESMQGAILRVKLRYLENWTEARRAHAARYTQLLAGSDLVLPQQVAGRRHVYHVYALQTRDRSRLQTELQAQGVSTGIHYPAPVHLLPAYADLGYHPGDLPVTEQIAASELSLPMFAELNEDQISQVVEALQICLKS